MGGQIVDASLISAPKQRNTVDEKTALKVRSYSGRVDSPTSQTSPEGP